MGKNTLGTHRILFGLKKIFLHVQNHFLIFFVSLKISYIGGKRDFKTFLNLFLLAKEYDILTQCAQYCNNNNSGQLYKTWIKDIQWLNHGYLQNSDNFLDSDCIKKRYPNCYPKRYPIG